MRHPLLAKISFQRKGTNLLMLALMGVMTVVALIPLLLVFFYVVERGLPGLTFSFFTQLPAAIGDVGGGMANALLGSLLLVVLASIGGVPLGVLAGIFLAEYPYGKFQVYVRFCIDLLTSVPSIIVGLFIYALIVARMGTFSGWAGGAALAFIMFPIIAKTTEEVLKLMPSHVREAGLALGLSRWKVILFIVVKGSMGAILTGVILAIARVAGETAPLLFTAFGNQYWSSSLNEPIASLPVQIYQYAISPFPEWHTKAWSGALVLVLMVFSINLMTRLLMRSRMGRQTR